MAETDRSGSAVSAFMGLLAQRVSSGFLDIFMLLLPMLEDLFAVLMDRCAETESEAILLMCHPTASQIEYMESKLFRKCRRRSPEFRRLSQRDKDRLVTQMVWRTINEAKAHPEMVAASWREVRAA